MYHAWHVFHTEELLCKMTRICLEDKNSKAFHNRVISAFIELNRRFMLMKELSFENDGKLSCDKAEIAEPMMHFIAFDVVLECNLDVMLGMLEMYDKSIRLVAVPMKPTTARIHLGPGGQLTLTPVIPKAVHKRLIKLAKKYKKYITVPMKLNSAYAACMQELLELKS